MPVVEVTKFSIVIPFRNEAENLNNLLKSLYKLNYPKHLFEIICVDDDSSVDSVKIITNFKTNNASLNITIITNKRI